MILGHYGLSGQPFGATPDPRFLYFSDSHREALASLRYSVHSGRGFSSLIAPPGLGKTTLLFRLLEDLEGQASTAFVFQTQCKPRELLRFILNEFSIQTPNSDLVTMHHALNEHLVAQARAGRHCVIILDESQNLNDSALESVRLLSDFETPRQKLLHIVLSGQPQLADKLLRPGLRQLQQRIGSVCKLEPLSPQDIEKYVEHRLSMAGYSGPPLFTPAAMAIVKEFSRGVPRNINALCFAALSLGFALNKKQLDARIMEEAASDLSYQPQLHGEFLPRTGKELGELPKEPEAPAVQPHDRHANPTQGAEGSVRTGDNASLPVAPAAIASQVIKEDSATHPPESRPAQAEERRVGAEDPVVRLEAEERAKRERAPDPLQNIDLGDYALLSGTERRRIRYEAYQPPGFHEPQRAISSADDEPDPELEALKRHLGQATETARKKRSGRGSAKQILAIAGFAVLLVGMVLIFLLWTRTSTSLAYSVPRAAPPSPQPSAVAEKKKDAPSLAPNPRAGKKRASANSTKAPRSANFSGQAAAQQRASNEAYFPEDRTVISGAYEPPPPVPTTTDPAESTELISAGAKSAESIVDMSQPGEAPLHIVAPVYPATAKELRIAGTVVLHANVDRDGRVVGVQKISGDPRLADAAVEAVQQWVYPPLVVDGKRQFTLKQIQIDFKLPSEAGAPAGDSPK